MARPLLCLLTLHRWRTALNDDGGTYERCTRCGAAHAPVPELPVREHRYNSGGF